MSYCLASGVTRKLRSCTNHSPLKANNEAYCPFCFSPGFFLCSAAQPVFVFGPAIVYSVPRVLSSDHWHLASDWSVTPTLASDWLSPIIHSVPCPPDHFTNTNTHSLNNPPSDIPFSPFKHICIMHIYQSSIYGIGIHFSFEKYGVI